MPPAPFKKSTLDQRIADAGGPVPLTVLTVCGEMIRRSSQPSSARPDETERALSALSLSQVSTALAGVDIASTKRELCRAMEEAFEAAFSEDAAERNMFATSSMTGLAARDSVSSTLVAARARLAMTNAAEQDGTSEQSVEAAIERIEREISALDSELSARCARSLTGVNRERRAELARLDEKERAKAWWYAARSDEGDDQLLAALGGMKDGQLGDAAMRDLEASELPTADGALLSSALRRTSLDATYPAERAWLESRGGSTPVLADAIRLAADRDLEEER